MSGPSGGSRPPIPVLYEDNHLLVVVKPPGIPSQEDESGDADMLTLLKEDLKLRHNKPGNVFLGLVHRLDRPVGGVMIFAKTSKAAGRLSDSVRTRTFRKTYLAVLSRQPQRAEGSLLHYLAKDSRRNFVTSFDRPTGDAKEARLSYRAESGDGGLALAAVRLHTGRPHQIRVQFAAIGCPLVGDLKYGASGGKPRPAAASSAHGDIALWSASAGIPHPVTKEWMEFRSLPPRESPWTLWSEEQLEQAAARLSATEL
ncbi:RluA family pseudouridine synthase [Paenibacillus pasadenensis]|uniref:RluA family pseudouridine synthase n=1 Tax=Paenibacillus pasadenensis TaxID=217090 RepID=UPI00203A7279|nr:RluA family pseudouridine synthase [Paenibacillus pasadenensis]MCM3749025.1 RluA family pseudouridine synthase [Paenibacillus pasadenensis]